MNRVAVIRSSPFTPSGYGAYRRAAKRVPNDRNVPKMLLTIIAASLVLDRLETMEPVYTPVIGVARGLFAAQGLKFTLEGEDNVPTSGGAVMMINHLSYMDFTYAGFPARRSKRLVRFMAKKEVFDHKVSGPLMRGMKHIPVDRGNGAASYRAAVNALRNGEIVGIFPEETISRSFELKSFKTGGVRMAAEAGVPILPTVIWGSQRIWTKGKPKHMGRTNTPITVSVGEHMYYDDSLTPEENTQRVKDVMQQMLTRIRMEYPRMSGDDLQFLPASMGGTAPTLEVAEELDAKAAAERRARKLAAARAAKEKQAANTK